MKRNCSLLPNLLVVCLPMALAMPGCGGCGPGNVTGVSGNVRLDGQPLPGANVTFSPTKEGGSTSLGITDSDGYYSLNYSNGVRGAEIGEHSVRISTFDEGAPDDEPPRPKVPERVPLKYNRKTELKREVTSGSNVIDFDLKSDGPIIADPSKTGPQKDDSCG